MNKFQVHESSYLFCLNKSLTELKLKLCIKTTFFTFNKIQVQSVEKIKSSFVHSKQLTGRMWLEYRKSKQKSSNRL